AGRRHRRGGAGPRAGDRNGLVGLVDGAGRRGAGVGGGAVVVAAGDEGQRDERRDGQGAQVVAAHVGSCSLRRRVRSAAISRERTPKGHSTTTVPVSSTTKVTDVWPTA